MHKITRLNNIKFLNLNEKIIHFSFLFVVLAWTLPSLLGRNNGSCNHFLFT